MLIEGKSLDDILICLYRQIIGHGKENKGTRGHTRELLGVTLRLSDPRARLSKSKSRGKPLSAIGELLWYLAGSNQLSFIFPYIKRYEKEAEKDGTIHGAYGPRLFSMRGSINQIESVLNLLRDHSSTRRAVIQLFDAGDIETHHKEIPCTTTIQFFVREGRLHMAVTMRSNDAFIGLPHDVFCFTMLQEMVATALGLDLGEYIHFAGSMHIYTWAEDDQTDYTKKAEKYVEAGLQRFDPMSAMPEGNPFEFKGRLLELEAKIRTGEWIEATEVMTSVYWADIVRLIQGFWAKKLSKDEWFDRLEAEISKPLQRYVKRPKKRA